MPEACILRLTYVWIFLKIIIRSDSSLTLITWSLTWSLNGRFWIVIMIKDEYNFINRTFLSHFQYYWERAGFAKWLIQPWEGARYADAFCGAINNASLMSFAGLQRRHSTRATARVANHEGQAEVEWLRLRPREQRRAERRKFAQSQESYAAPRCQPHQQWQS